MRKIQPAGRATCGIPHGCIRPEESMPRPSSCGSPTPSLRFRDSTDASSPYSRHPARRLRSNGGRSDRTARRRYCVPLRAPSRRVPSRIRPDNRRSSRARRSDPVRSASRDRTARRPDVRIGFRSGPCGTKRHKAPESLSWRAGRRDEVPRYPHTPRAAGRRREKEAVSSWSAEGQMMIFFLK